LILWKSRPAHMAGRIFLAYVEFHEKFAS
jgi:hypothetical protein